MCEGLPGMTRSLQSRNPVGDEGARGLGLGLRANSSLRTLHLVRVFIDLFCFLMCFDHVL
jgi:hypothetical protein